MQEFQELIGQCRTIHRFSNQHVSVDKIVKALELSLQAPNHKFTFPWKYYLVGEESQKKVVKLALELKFGTDYTPDDEASLVPKLVNPKLVFLCQKQNVDPFFAKEDYATMSCSVQIMALSLTEQGLGYKWSTGKFTRDEKLYEILGVDKKREQIIGCIMIGHAENPPKERKRPPLSEVLTYLN